MATEILINDGGAPARILPFTAGSTIAAGEPIGISSDGFVDFFDPSSRGHECVPIRASSASAREIAPFFFTTWEQPFSSFTRFNKKLFI